MIRIDSGERGVEPDGPLEESDQSADRSRPGIGDGDRDRLPSVLEQRAARPEEESGEEVARRDPRLDLDRRSPAFLQDRDEGREEVVHSLAELLHVRVLVGRAFVAVDRDPLVDDASLKVPLLAERLHDELLEVLAEEDEPVAIGKHDHVLRPAPASRVMPHEREQGRGVLRDAARPRGLVHQASPFEHLADSDPLQRGGQQPDRGKLRGPPSDPVPHREAGEEPFGDGVAVEQAPFARHSSGMPAEAEPCGGVDGCGLEHAVARFLGAAGLGDDERQGLVDLFPDPIEDPVDPVGIGVVDEMRPHAVRRPAESVGNELRSEGRASDADHEKVREGRLALRPDAGRVHVAGERLDRRQCRLDRASDRRVGGERGRPQPVVSDHSVLVGVGDRALLEGRHGLERPLQGPAHPIDEPVGKVHPAHVDRESDRLDEAEVFAATIPESSFGHGLPSLRWRYMTMCTFSSVTSPS